MEHTTTAAMPATATKLASRTRWGILAILFIVTTVNYADRASISIAGPEIRKALGLSPVEMGFVFSAFAWSYVAAQLPGGWLLDRFGSKITYFFSIFLWSLFTLLTGGVGFVTGAAAVATLFVLRFLVGAAEAPSFPGNSRITSAWFPTHERGLASALFNSAQYFATVLFAPIMGWLVHAFGWESVFIVMGGLGIALAFVWLKVIHGPKDHPSVSAGELEYIGRQDSIIRGGGVFRPVDDVVRRAETRDRGAREGGLDGETVVGLQRGQDCVRIGQEALTNAARHAGATDDGVA